MPVSKAKRVVAHSQQAVWALAADPKRLPDWWPRVERVEGIAAAGFTEVRTSKSGRQVRIDYHVTEHEPPRRRAWSQELAGTPFERVFTRSETVLLLSPADGGTTEVRLELRQKLPASAKLGGFLVRRSSKRQLREALDALETLLG